jgi:hypothetical protein
MTHEPTELKHYIHKLIENLNKNDIPKKIDLILDGGSFNGAYQLGTLMYLKELEKTKSMPFKIKRISGTSVGAILGGLYLLDLLDIVPEIYLRLLSNFRNQFQLNELKNMLDEIGTKYLKEDDCKRLNNKMYITYYNNNSKSQIICSKYNSNRDLIEILKKSSHIPFFMDGKQTYNDCVDGMFPYIFKKRKKEMLYINLKSFKHVTHSFSIKNEDNIYSRLFEGIVDINHFFTKNKRTTLCSYIKDWNILDFIIFRASEMSWVIILIVIDFLISLKHKLPDCVVNSNCILGGSNVIYKLYGDIVSHLLG